MPLLESDDKNRKVLSHLLFIRTMEQILVVLRDGGVIVSVAHDPIHRPTNITTSDIANDCAISATKSTCVRADPIVVLNRRLNPAVLRDSNAHG
jgi:hypothetical protein